MSSPLDDLYQDVILDHGRKPRNFHKLDGEQPHGIYDMVITNVERSLLSTIMMRAGGNQTQAADMLGLNRNTLRSKLSKYNIR